MFRPELDQVLAQSDWPKGGRPPLDADLMFKILVLQARYGMSHEQAEFQIRDRLTRAVERVERDVTVGNEALALFVKFWLTTTPPLPDTLRDAAQAQGRERYEGFVEALGRRLAKGGTLAKEVSRETSGEEPKIGSPP
ncbi:MAG: transposase [Bacteroidales bacterium]|nr:transposase [Bacteroidales bacterium]